MNNQTRASGSLVGRIAGLLWIVCALSGAEEACKFEYLGPPHNLIGKTLVVPDEVVAMSEYVHIQQPVDIINVGNPCSIMFIVDVSSSNTADRTDLNGVRFDVMKAVLDSIYNRNPNVMVGMVFFGNDLWFYPPDDPLFEGSSRGYIPLLQLNKTYSGTYTLADNWQSVISRTPYTKPGIDVLKMYLDKRANWNTVVGGMVQKYWPTTYIGELTNITAAFEGAKTALNQSPHPKNKRFNIFFSDGYATVGGNGYVQGTNVPTTFTIFYKPLDQQSLQALQQMTQNIKINNFSTSNTMSNIWDLNMNYDQLLKLIIQNIISQIITNMIIFETQDVQVNGLGPITGWDSTGFYFQNFFPLKAKSTPFHYEIDYKIKKDSITENGDTIHVGVWDTTHVIDYTVEIQDGAPVPDSVELTCWGRNLEFYYNGKQITVANDTMDQLEIRFSEYKVDTLYGYKNVVVDISQTAGMSHDLEKFTLANNGAYCSYTFNRESGNPNAGDGKLQHQNPDSIVATFRNPALPLDTLRVTIPYYEGYDFAVSRGVYFDNDADGKIDSIFVGIAGKKLEEYIDKIVDSLPLPAHRDFEVVGYKQVDGGIGLTVKENAAAILTFVTAADIIAIPDTIELDTDACVLPCSVTIIDSVAPIIMAASFIDSLKDGARDELTVSFSEKVKSISGDKPFSYFSKADNKVFDATLAALSQSDSIGVFEVKSLSGVARIMNGDSIRINWIYADNVCDNVGTKGNNQNNPDNVRREINVRVIEKGMKLQSAVYFDRTADGYVDSIFLEISGKTVDLHVTELMNEIVLPSIRNFKVNGSTYSNGGIALDVTEQSNLIRTYVTGDDVIEVLQDKVFSSGESVVKSSVNAMDSIAPVVMTAHLVDSLKDGAVDELRVSFSESVEQIATDKPFKFYNTKGSGGNKEYDAVLSMRKQSANVAYFKVESLTGVSRIVEGDSLWIHWIYDTNVKDTIGNNQNNRNNRKCVISVDFVPDDYVLVVKSIIYKPQKEYPLPENFKSIPQVWSVLKNLGEVETNTYKGIMIITLEPDPVDKFLDTDSLSGYFSVYDAVGNTLVQDRELGFDREGKRLVYVWDGYNELGRQVGPGTYMAVFESKRFLVSTSDTQLWRTFRHIEPIGVQE